VRLQSHSICASVVTRDSGVDLFLHYYKKNKEVLPEPFKALQKDPLCGKESKDLLPCTDQGVNLLDQDLEVYQCGVDPPDLQEALIVGIAPLLRAN
jgi:hypothetical protein